MLARFARWYLEPDPTRLVLLRVLDKTFRFLSYETRIKLGSIERPAYGHCLRKAAQLARRLGLARISAIEFGVAGGRGLLALEMHAALVTKQTGIDIEIYGFDAGDGMPAPVDYRDIPYLWQAGYFKMDIATLQSMLRTSRLILGPVKDTVRDFIQIAPAPIGFIAFDLDYYSSTMDALSIFEIGEAFLMPRVACYFDDIVGDVDYAYNEFTGELLAISEFNSAHAGIKIAPVRGMRFFDGAIPRLWHEQVFVAHCLHHQNYGTPVSDLKQLPV